MSEISVLADFKILTLARAREEGPGESKMGRSTGYLAGGRSPQAPAGTPANTQNSAMKKANRERLTFVNWWRGAESNASPQLRWLPRLIIFVEIH